MRRAAWTLVVAAAAGAPAVALAAAPVATTLPPRDVRSDRATLVARVDPGGETTTVRFDIGTTTAYGLQTGARTVSGDDPVEVAIPVSGLTPDTRYHARALAENASGDVTAGDRAFRTAPVTPRPPVAVTAGATDVRATSATLNATVDPERGRTTYRFEFGPTTAYGRRTATRTLPPGDRPVRVSVRVSGLRPATVHHFRVVASNAAGQRAGRDRALRTTHGVRGATLAVTPPIAVWGRVVTASGTVRATAPRGVPVTLERQEWPFTGPFNPVGRPVRADARGRVSFAVPVFRTVRLRLRAASALTRPLVVRARPLVGLRVRREGGTLRFAGAVWPRLEGARVSLQRRSRSGHWAPIVRTPIAALDATRSRYAVRARATRRAATWRVVVTPVADGAYLRGTSRVLRVRGTAR